MPENSTLTNHDKGRITRNILILIILLMVVVFVYAQFSHIKGWVINPTVKSRQMLLVTAKNWTATTGVLQRYQRPSTHKAWQKVGAPIAVVLGKNGLGWGIGLHGSSLTRGPIVTEGGRRAPAGVFAIKLAFGKDSKDELGVKLPYLQITPTIFCPNDVKSKYYNRLVDTNKVKKDWRTAENMQAYVQKGLYTYGALIENNYKRPKLWRDSCIFLHVYKAPNHPTQGGTAFAAPQVKMVITWLDPKKKPILVQLPAHLLKLFHKHWDLPIN